MPKTTHFCKLCGEGYMEYVSNNRKFCSRNCYRNHKSIEMLENHPKYWLGKKRCSEDKIKISRNNHNKNKFGILHYSWKGDYVKYVAFHQRVYRAFGKAKKCEQTECEGKSPKYQWANLTGNYSDINDYKQMCIKCHRKYDLKRRKINE